MLYLCFMFFIIKDGGIRKPVRAVWCSDTFVALVCVCVCVSMAITSQDGYCCHQLWPECRPRVLMTKIVPCRQYRCQQQSLIILQCYTKSHPDFVPRSRFYVFVCYTQIMKV